MEGHYRPVPIALI